MLSVVSLFILSHFSHATIDARLQVVSLAPFDLSTCHRHSDLELPQDECLAQFYKKRLKAEFEKDTPHCEIKYQPLDNQFVIIQRAISTPSGKTQFELSSLQGEELPIKLTCSSSIKTLSDLKHALGTSIWRHPDAT